MTVRCDACGTENRDKAMFCRGCAGKLAAFTPTKTPASGKSDGARLGSPTPGVPMAPDTSHVSSTRMPGRFLFSGIRTAVFVLLMAVLVAAMAWFVLRSVEGKSPTSPARPAAVDGRLPAEASLSTGETLEASGASGFEAKPREFPLPLPDNAASTVPVESPPKASAALPGTTSSMETAIAEGDSPTTQRSTSRRSTAPANGNSNSNGRVLDPRLGCEHLFFAFAARCEANHCQQPAYARHPRCDAVREQRRRDDARRDSMPTS